MDQSSRRSCPVKWKGCATEGNSKSWTVRLEAISTELLPGVAPRSPMARAWTDCCTPALTTKSFATSSLKLISSGISLSPRATRNRRKTMSAKGSLSRCIRARPLIVKVLHTVKYFTSVCREVQRRKIFHTSGRVCCWCVLSFQDGWAHLRTCVNQFAEPSRLSSRCELVQSHFASK